MGAIYIQTWNQTSHDKHLTIFFPSDLLKPYQRVSNHIFAHVLTTDDQKHVWHTMTLSDSISRLLMQHNDIHHIIHS